MDLLEYQAKELFRTVGIPVLPSQTIHQVRELKDLTVPYPVVLKSQVHAGGRGRLGGVRFVENTIDGIAAAQAIFNLPIDGEYPKVLLAEVKYAVEREFYLAVTLHPALRRPVLLGSLQGGVTMQSSMEHTQQVVVEGEFSAFYARQLAVAMGVTGELINPVSDVVEKMYALMVQKDLDLVEINPLAVRGETAVMALDGKVVVNDAALVRHPDLMVWCESAGPITLGQMPTLQLSHDAAGTIGIVGNGSELVLATVDQVLQAGGRYCCSVNLGGETHYELTSTQFGERLLAGLIQMAQQPLVAEIVVNVLTGVVTGEAILEVLQGFDQQLQKPIVPVGVETERVVLLPQPQEPERLVIALYCGGLKMRLPRSRFKRLDVKIYEDLPAAIAAVVQNTPLT
ncbi:succinate--CoA ligase subunit beta [filamentous cyanobacterium LEGE 11480]|uniref:Succinate--CoA ligase subunit beta n=1 Tax=Romeriopsis navalis LEGE 11480 TaxID=2777977 RepID=A0A928VTT4_9CYAN|nr:ATP-grasp domain-containing protein [Romeriopsis navalis]MBE9032455.1 succinate--CoA ligase subunit beta [Romeriopsis navalis LEGE 11480]